MSKNVIFCFSASGNCLDIAKNMAAHMIDTDIVMMRSAPAVTDVRSAQRVGFVFPCYAGGLPDGVEEYVASLQIDPKAYIFAVCSYAGYPGIGLSRINKLVKLDYWAGISHQCSCIWLFPHNLMMPPMNAEQAQKRSERLAKQLAYDVLDGKKKDKAPSENPVNAVEYKAWPMLKDQKAGKMKASDACIGCGQCEKLCPRGNIRLVDGKPSFGANCIGCLSCLQYCPQQAIDMGGVTVKRERYHNPKVTAEELCQSVIHY